MIFHQDLLELFMSWRVSGCNIILGIDANQNVYTGHLASLLCVPPISMTCLIHDTMACCVSISHHHGCQPITTLSGTPGIITEHAMCFPHLYGFGVGDHRTLVIEVTAASLFGGTLPKTTQPECRLLNRKVECIWQLHCCRPHT